MHSYYCPTGNLLASDMWSVKCNFALNAVFEDTVTKRAMFFFVVVSISNAVLNKRRLPRDACSAWSVQTKATAFAMLAPSPRGGSVWLAVIHYGGVVAGGTSDCAWSDTSAKAT